jgi:hypothetical protein
MSEYQVNWPKETPARGDYVRTRSGVKFYTLDPRPDEVRLDDIAFALGNVPRWGGHCYFYSVAQHAVECALLALNRGVDAFQMLHHDDSEAYLGDMPRPVKRGLPDYRKAETRLMLAISEALGFEWPLSREAHALDTEMMVAESRRLFPNSTREDFPGPSSWTLSGPIWTPVRASLEFLRLHNELKKT